MWWDNRCNVGRQRGEVRKVAGDRIVVLVRKSKLADESLLENEQRRELMGEKLEAPVG